LEWLAQLAAHGSSVTDIARFWLPTEAASQLTMSSPGWVSRSRVNAPAPVRGSFAWPQLAPARTIALLSGELTIAFGDVPRVPDPDRRSTSKRAVLTAVQSVAIEATLPPRRGAGLGAGSAKSPA
jgi:hypothetical protein